MSAQARINLLPWREEERKRKNIEFGIMAGAGALLAAILVGAVYMYFDDRISYQERRNSFLKNEIKVLDSKLETIKKLEETKQNLLARMNIIQELQGSRPQTVHLFEELVITIPDGIWLTSIIQRGNSLNVEGITESNARVSAFMRNLDESDWLTSPKLVSIDKAADGNDAKFVLELQQALPETEDEQGGDI